MWDGAGVAYFDKKLQEFKCHLFKINIDQCFLLFAVVDALHEIFDCFMWYSDNAKPRNWLC